MPIYNKLVRDLIPQIIKESGKKCETKILNDEQYIKELKKKVEEELLEYKEAKTDDTSLEELADLLELIYALAQVHGASIEELESIRKQKAKKRGSFRDKVFLIEVEDE